MAALPLSSWVEVLPYPAAVAEKLVLTFCAGETREAQAKARGTDSDPGDISPPMTHRHSHLPAKAGL